MHKWNNKSMLHSLSPPPFLSKTNQEIHDFLKCKEITIIHPTLHTIVLGLVPLLEAERRHWARGWPSTGLWSRSHRLRQGGSLLSASARPPVGVGVQGTPLGEKVCELLTPSTAVGRGSLGQNQQLLLHPPTPHPPLCHSGCSGVSRGVCVRPQLPARPVLSASLRPDPRPSRLSPDLRREEGPGVWKADIFQS